jgi:hypothetical protein
MKKTIAQQVAEAESLLRTLGTHTELREWAIKNGMDNRSAFPKFKAALLNIGIDYDKIKTGIHAMKAAEVENAITHEVTLYTDAKASAGRYGICDKIGNVVMHGRFFDDDDAGEQSRAELCAAKKAVWLASKIKEAVGATAIKLTLLVDAQWLVWQDHAGQKGYVLTQMARKYNIQLSVEWIPGSENPADKWTVASGYKKWSDNDLVSLAKALNV